MGVVYLAHDADGHPVALKTILASYARDPRFRERFREEFRAMRRIPRPFVARVLDADPGGDPPWLATEYVEGPTLQEVVDRDRPWSYGEVKDLALATAMALRQIHAVGVVHRDFKPANVLLSVKTVPKVIDFGLATAAEYTLPPSSRQGLGSLHYAAPEVLRGDEGKEAADVFAWAGTMVFASTGRPPFGTGTKDQLRQRILYEQPDLDGVDARLRRILAAALRKDPLARPSAEDLLQMLGITTGKLEAEQRLVEASLADRWKPPEAATERDGAPTATVDNWATTTEVFHGDRPHPAPTPTRLRARRWLHALDQAAMPSWWYGLLIVVVLLLVLLVGWMALAILVLVFAAGGVALAREPRLRAWLRHRRAGAPYYRALRLERLGRRQEAEKLLWDIALRGRERWAPRAAITLGNLLREQGRVRPAIEAYEEACRLVEEQPAAGPAERELAALAALNLGHAYQAEQKRREAQEAYRQVRVLAGQGLTRRAENHIRRAAQWRQELMRRSEIDDSRAAGRRAPPPEAPPPLRYWPAAAALAIAVLWCALEVLAALTASDGSTPLLRPRVAIVILLIGVAAVVLAVGARHDLKRLGPLVHARGFILATFTVTASGFAAGIAALVVAAVAS
jgi:tetratricopeptide (TPR) repeat protein